MIADYVNGKDIDDFNASCALRKAAIQAEIEEEKERKRQERIKREGHDDNLDMGSELPFTHKKKEMRIAGTPQKDLRKQQKEDATVKASITFTVLLAVTLIYIFLF
jgi:hypothetical protein